MTCSKILQAIGQHIRFGKNLSSFLSSEHLAVFIINFILHLTYLFPFFLQSHIPKNWFNLSELRPVIQHLPTLSHMDLPVLSTQPAFHSGIPRRWDCHPICRSGWWPKSSSLHGWSVLSSVKVDHFSFLARYYTHKFQRMKTCPVIKKTDVQFRKSDTKNRLEQLYFLLVYNYQFPIYVSFVDLSTEEVTYTCRSIHTHRNIKHVQ